MNLIHGQTLPLGSKVYLLGGLTDASHVGATEGGETATAASRRDVPEPIVLNSTVEYDTYSETAKRKANMPQPRFVLPLCKDGLCLKALMFC